MSESERDEAGFQLSSNTCNSLRAASRKTLRICSELIRCVRLPVLTVLHALKSHTLPQEWMVLVEIAYQASS